MQKFLDDMAEDFGISEDFKQASDHDYNCRCDICLEWWSIAGPDDDESAPYGPFTEKEVVEYRKAQSEG